MQIRHPIYTDRNEQRGPPAEILAAENGREEEEIVAEAMCDRPDGTN